MSRLTQYNKDMIFVIDSEIIVRKGVDFWERLQKPKTPGGKSAHDVLIRDRIRCGKNAEELTLEAITMFEAEEAAEEVEAGLAAFGIREADS